MKHSYPFFIRGFQSGEIQLNIDPGWDYVESCNQGKAAAYDFIRFNIEQGGCAGRCLQNIALFHFKNKPSERGFAVGFFTEVEKLLNQAYRYQEQAERIKERQLNHAGNSPLSYREKV